MAAHRAPTVSIGTHGGWERPHELPSGTEVPFQQEYAISSDVRSAYTKLAEGGVVYDGSSSDLSSETWGRGMVYGASTGPSFDTSAGAEPHGTMTMWGGVAPRGRPGRPRDPVEGADPKVVKRKAQNRQAQDKRRQKLKEEAAAKNKLIAQLHARINALVLEKQGHLQYIVELRDALVTSHKHITLKEEEAHAEPREGSVGTDASTDVWLQPSAEHTGEAQLGIAAIKRRMRALEMDLDNALSEGTCHAQRCCLQEKLILELKHQLGQANPSRTQ